jgi:hypothetical protein
MLTFYQYYSKRFRESTRYFINLSTFRLCAGISLEEQEAKFFLCCSIWEIFEKSNQESQLLFESPRGSPYIGFWNATSIGAILEDPFEVGLKGIAPNSMLVFFFTMTTVSLSRDSNENVWN